MNPVMKFAEWAVKRTDWWKSTVADLEAARQESQAARSELEAARIDIEIDRVILESQTKQAVAYAKIALVDELREALEARRG